MPKTKLTDAAVAEAALPEGKTETVLWDSDVTGFGLRIRPGARTWIVAYRPAGAGRSATTKRLKLGTPEATNAAAARKLARVALGNIAAGGDPLGERREARRRAASAVGELLDRYDADLERRGYVNRKVVVSGLRRRLKPFLERGIAELTGADLAGIVEALNASGQKGAADDFRSRCRAFLTWCMTVAKVLPANPLAGHRKQRATRADRLAKPRYGRALSDAELTAVWNAASPDRVAGRFIRFLILTGCRRGEGAGLAWPMVDRDAGVINLPAQFVKQGRAHVVALTPALDALLAACPIDARSDHVFPSNRTGGRMSGWNRMTAAAVKASGVEFSFHDLRRTFRTGLSRLGVSTETAELALGHARANLIAIYDRDAGADAVRDAFERWAEHVEKVTAPADAGVFG